MLYQTFENELRQHFTHRPFECKVEATSSSKERRQILFTLLADIKLVKIGTDDDKVTFEVYNISSVEKFQYVSTSSAGEKRVSLPSYQFTLSYHPFFEEFKQQQSKTWIVRLKEELQKRVEAGVEHKLNQNGKSGLFEGSTSYRIQNAKIPSAPKTLPSFGAAPRMELPSTSQKHEESPWNQAIFYGIVGFGILMAILSNFAKADSLSGILWNILFWGSFGYAGVTAYTKKDGTLKFLLRSIGTIFAGILVWFLLEIWFISLPILAIGGFFFLKWKKKKKTKTSVQEM